MIFVLHGYSDATPNEDTEFLTNLFPLDEVIGLNYPFSPPKTVQYLHQTVEDHLKQKTDNTPLLFVGISLGAFWAWHCATWFNGAAILINPSLRPWDSLKRMVGTFRIVRSRERFTFTTEDVEALKDYPLPEQKIPLLALLDRGDERFDNVAVQRELEPLAKTVLFDGGSHRFDHRPESSEFVLAFYQAAASGANDR